MKIVFMGASDLGWECCRALLEMEQHIVGIFSIPKEFRITWSSQPVTNVRYKGFEDLAEQYSIPLVYINKKVSDPEYEEILKRLQPNLIVVIGWYYILPRSWRRLSSQGAIGIHASLLPKYRGGAPLVWAIINGENRAGVSLFYLSDGIDDGDIIGQVSFSIDFEDFIANVCEKASRCSVKLIRDFIPLVAEGKAPRRPQDNLTASVVPQRNPEDGLLDWASKTVLQAYNWVRAQSLPYPGAFTYLGKEKIYLWKASISTNCYNDHAQPGEIITSLPDSTEVLGVQCMDGRYLCINNIGLSDGTVINGAKFKQIRAVTKGVKFHSGNQIEC